MLQADLDIYELWEQYVGAPDAPSEDIELADRKSTRLNSSH